MICELCGRDAGFLSSVRVGSSVVRACSGCRRYGAAVGGMTGAQQVAVSQVLQGGPMRQQSGFPRSRAPLFTHLREQSSGLSDAEEVVVADFGRRIGSARQRKGLKQEELARRLMEKESVIKAVETGKRRPSLSLARRLEKVLGVGLIEEL